MEKELFDIFFEVVHGAKIGKIPISHIKRENKGGTKCNS